MVTVPVRGLDQWIRFLYPTLTPELKARFDLVAFDPRGTDRSAPITCGTTEEYRQMWEVDKARPTPDGFERAVKQAKTFNERCMHDSAEMLPYIGTAYAARDMDLLRAAVGDEKLSLAGFSYATYLGTVYANMFPDKVRAMSLDSAYDPFGYARTNRIFRSEFDQFVNQDKGVERSLDWCKNAPSYCRFGGGDPRGAFLRLQQRLDDAPVRDANGKVLANGYTFSFDVMSRLSGGKVRWQSIADELANAERGTGYFMNSDRLDQEAQFLMRNTAIECADRPFPRSLSLLRSVMAAEVKAAPLLGPAFAHGLPSYDQSHGPACVQWPAERKSNYTGAFNARGKTPILVVSPTGDNDVRYEDSVTLANTLTNAQLLTFKGEDHIAYRNSACVREKITDYLINLTMPPPNAVCDDDMVVPTG